MEHLREVIVEATIVDMEPAAGRRTSRAVAEEADSPAWSVTPGPQPHILFAGDEAISGLSIAEYLRDKRLRVTSVPYGDAMRATLDTSVVVDLVLLAPPPELELGEVLAARLREECSVPFIILSAQREETDRIIALELGADDCLTAPFSPRELLARLRAILRRRRIDWPQRKARGLRAYRFGGWELNLHTRRLHSAAGHQTVLSNGEFNLLAALLGAGERTLSRMQLLELSRLYDDEVYDRAVDVQILRLRRKLEADAAAPRYVLTVRGAGYRFGVRVEPVY